MCNEGKEHSGYAKREDSDAINNIKNDMLNMCCVFQERRKSRDDQKREFVLLENREEIWKTQLEEKSAEIMDLNKRVTVRPCTQGNR